MTNRIISYLCLVVIAVEIVAITGAWIASAVNPFGMFNNPLSGEGVRWMFRNMMLAMSSKYLVALLLLAISYGSMRDSGLWKSLFSKSRQTRASSQYRERMGQRLALFVTFIFLVIMALLTMLPEALLLSATGDIFPSPFSEAILPAVSIWITTTSILFGMVKGSFNTIPQVFNSFFNGISRCAPAIVLFLLSSHCVNVIKMLVK
ncbi:MAG: AbgT family transporter [Prevotella sp.]